MIIGGGFGGLTAARELVDGDVDVTLVDRHSHHLFQPLLYQAACGGLGAGEVATPIREPLRDARNVDVLMAAATDIDVAARRVRLDSGETLAYDSLIVACGAETSYFGNAALGEHSYALKTLADTLALRERVFSAFEEAERAGNAADRDRWGTFVVVGGGPTGVEFAGELGLLTHRILKRSFRNWDPASAKVHLLDAGPRLTAAFDPRLSTKVGHYLDELDVSVHHGARVNAIDEHGVDFTVDGRDERIEARTVVWAAGVQAVGLCAKLAASAGVQPDRAGHLPVGQDCSLAGHPEISVIGDAAATPGPGDRPLPGLATVAIQQARHVCEGIRAGAPGANGPFKYFDKGALAVVGRGRAVCEVRGLRLSGRPAFFMYLTVHMYYLTGGGPGHRLKVLIDWLNARFGQPQNQVIEGELPPRGS